MNQTTHRQKSVLGFTLIELMTTLCIGVLLIVISAPMANLLKSSKTSSVAYEFASALNYARSEAITRGNQVTVCRTINGKKCEGYPDINKQKVWDGGWMVFSDQNGNGQFNSTQDEILRVHEPLPPGYSLRSNAKVRVTYKPIGISPGFMDSWTICAPGTSSASTKGIIVAYTGRVRFAEDTNKNGIIDNGTKFSKGKPKELSCNT